MIRNLKSGYLFDQTCILTSWWVDVDLEPPLGGDDAVVVVVVQVGDVVAIVVVQAELLQGNANLL